MNPKTDRLEVRVTSQNREQIRTAAETVSESTSDFIRNAALERADRILALSSRTLMPADQFDVLIESLDTPDEALNLAQLADEPRRFSRQ